MYLRVVILKSNVFMYSIWNVKQLDCIHRGTLRLMLLLFFGYDGMNGTDECRQVFYVPVCCGVSVFVVKYSFWFTQQLDCIYVGFLRLMRGGMNRPGGHVDKYPMSITCVLRSVSVPVCCDPSVLRGFVQHLEHTKIGLHSRWLFMSYPSFII